VQEDHSLQADRPARVLSISDKRPNGGLNFDLKDVLGVLGPAIQEYWWLVTEFDCFGPGYDLALKVNATNGSGLVLSGTELMEVAEHMRQTLDATLLAIPTRLATSEDSVRRLTSADVTFADVPIAIMAIDTSFYEVFTRREGDEERLRSRFRDVREGDPSFYIPTPASAMPPDATSGQ
jgi:hypothetical protein